MEWQTFSEKTYVYTPEMLNFIISSRNSIIGYCRVIYLFKINELGSFSVGYKFKLTGKFEVRKTGTKRSNKQNPAISYNIYLFFHIFPICRKVPFVSM